jgi:hypothetical protein
MDVEVPSGPDAHKKDAPPATSEAKTSSSSGGGAGGQGTESGEGDAKSAGAGAVDAARQKIIENQGLVLRYPRINADFRKKDKASLLKILKHYGVTPKPELEQPELAIMTARFFVDVNVKEEEIVDKFATTHCKAVADPSLKKRTFIRSALREQLDSEPARAGEQIAALVNNNGEDGYILGNVLDYDSNLQTYEIQDEDDVNRILYLNNSNVKRLEDSAAHLRRGDSVLAVFPETTSFYRAMVAKNPKPPQHGNGGWDVVCRFEDDEDVSGKAPPRKVPGRFVLRRADIGDEGEGGPA